MRSTLFVAAALAAVAVALPGAANTLPDQANVPLVPIFAGPEGIPTRAPGERLRDIMAIYNGSSHAGQRGRRAVGGSFTIIISYSGTVLPEYQACFQAAADAWSTMLPAYLPGITAGSLTIAASFPYIDGAGKILGQAGPTAFRSALASNGKSYYLSTGGTMQFDSADAANMYSAGTLDDVILHEMGHVIGIGTQWSRSGYQNVYSSGTGKYTGALGNSAYVRELSNEATTYIPVELGGGSGTANAHWNELDGGACCTGLTVTRNGNTYDITADLMTGWLNSGGWVSAYTAISLGDVGFSTSVCVDDSDCSGGDTCVLYPGCTSGNAASCLMPSLCSSYGPATAPTPAPPPPTTVAPCGPAGSLCSKYATCCSGKCNKGKC